LDILDFEVENEPKERKKKVYQPLSDPKEAMSDHEFKLNFRFSKDSVQRITDMLTPDFQNEDNKGLPAPPFEQVCITLYTMGGGQFQRISGFCFGISQSTARLCILRVTDALIKLKDEYMHLPDVEEMAATAERIYQRFHLPRFCMAVDGMHVRFPDAPRGLPDNTHKQAFWCRKQYYSLNVQIMAGDKYIYDFDCGWPGSTHDARIWNRSEVKRHMEEQRRFLVAGDTGYPISEVLIKPYSTREVGGDVRMRTFNRQLSGLRTVMSENIHGVLKRRFPILRSMRMNLVVCQKIIIATGILFNMGRKWGDEEPEAGDEEDNDGAQDVIVQDVMSVANLEDK
jgi:hypothetical protein